MITDHKIGEMNLDELQAFRKRVDRAIVTKTSEETKRAAISVRDLARDLDIPLSALLSELTRMVPSTEKMKRKPRRTFVHPENREITWNGAGRRPEWVKDHLAAGGRLDDLAR